MTLTDKPALRPPTRDAGYVRAFLDGEILPRVAAYDAAGGIPNEIVEMVGREVGYGLATEVSRLEWVGIVEEFGRADSALRTFVTVQADLVYRTMLAAGSDAQVALWRELLADGRAIGAFAFTEPDAGSDAAALSSQAVSTGAGIRIAGRKAWITNGVSADLAIVFARRSDPASSRNVGAYLVNPKAGGWVASPILDKLGLRALEVADVVLENVAAEELGKDGLGWSQAMATIDDGRLSVAAGSVGLAQACLEASIDYARQRKQFGKSIASFQLIQQLVADTAVDVLASRSLVEHTARERDGGARSSALTSAAKLFATEAAERCAYRAMQVHGSHGYSGAFPVERYYRDARGATLYQGTSEIQRLIIGRSALGVSAISS